MCNLYLQLFHMILLVCCALETWPPDMCKCTLKCRQVLPKNFPGRGWNWGRELHFGQWQTSSDIVIWGEEYVHSQGYEIYLNTSSWWGCPVVSWFLILSQSAVLALKVCIYPQTILQLQSRTQSDRFVLEINGTKGNYAVIFNVVKSLSMILKLSDSSWQQSSFLHCCPWYSVWNGREIRHSGKTFSWRLWAPAGVMYYAI